MSIRLGNNIVAGRSTYQPSLFDFKWADHLLHDVQWLRADTFSWQYGSVYTPAYEHLVADIEGKEPLSETIDDIIITYYLANDGHKICMADQEGYVKRVFEKTGVAWYYILDIPFQRFKLPRTQFGFQGLKQYGNPGEYDKPGLPNITGSVTGDGFNGTNGIFWNNVGTGALEAKYETVGSNIAQYSSSLDAAKVTKLYLNAADSNVIYGNSTTVQTPASEMYLYFYVGNFTQTALENTAGVSLEGVQEIMDESAVTMQGIIDEGIDAIDAAMSDLDTMINAQYHPNIFESKWTDNILNDIQWLRSNTNSWQSGSVYETAYNHLADDVQNSSIQKQIYVNHNVTTMGNVAVNENGILSGFAGTTSYGIGNGVFVPTTSFELVVKTIIPSSITDQQNIISYDPTTNYTGMLLRVASTTSVKIWLSSNGTSWNIADGTAFTCDTIPAGSTVWLKVTWNGTIYTIFVSKDGINYTSIGTITNSNPINFSTGKFTLGGFPINERPLTGGSIDLKESYIKIDDQVVWKGANLITYTEAEDGHKIVSADQAEYVNYIYNKTGTAWYYVLDTVNERFKLPRKHSTQIIQSVKNSDGTWYKLYADGWVEQGGKITVADATNTAVVFPIVMADTRYIMTAGQMTYNLSSAQYANGWGLTTYSTTGFTVHSATNGTNTFAWEVKGMSSIDVSSFQSNEKYLYFYVGKFLQSAVVNTAGLNAELFNGKVDKGHEVIAFQAPTAENSYTWYRKYADGWVEQGGQITTSTSSASSSGNTTVTFPIEFANTGYYFSMTGYVSSTSETIRVLEFGALTKTTSNIKGNAAYISSGGESYKAKLAVWKAEGMAA